MIFVVKGGSLRSKNAGFRNIREAGIPRLLPPFLRGAWQALTPASGVAFPFGRKPSYHHKTPVVITTKINGITAGFKAFPLFGVGKVMTFCVAYGKAKPQFLLVFLEQLNIKELRRHHQFFTFPIKHIKRFKVSTISSSCLGDVGGVGGVGDEIIYVAAKVNAGFATAVEDEEVIRWRDLFVLKDVVAGGKLFFGHWVVGICGTPYTYGVMPCGGSNTFTFLHCVNVRHIQHTGFAAREIFKGLPQAAIWLDGAVLVLAQLGGIQWNNVLRTSQLIKRFGCGSDTYHHDGRVGCGFTDGVAGNAGEVGLRAVCGEDDDVVCLVADDDLKARGKGWIVPDPYAKLGVGGYNSFVRRQFAPGDVGSRCFRKEHIGHRQGFVLRQTKVAVLGVNKEKCFAGR